MNHIIWYIVYIMYEHEFDVQANNFLKVVVRPRPQIVGPVVCPWSKCDTGYHWTLIFKTIIKRDSSICQSTKDHLFTSSENENKNLTTLFNRYDMFNVRYLIKTIRTNYFVLIISYSILPPPFIKNIINTTFE